MRAPTPTLGEPGAYTCRQCGYRGEKVLETGGGSSGVPLFRFWSGPEHDCPGGGGGSLRRIGENAVIDIGPPGPYECPECGEVCETVLETFGKDGNVRVWRPLHACSIAGKRLAEAEAARKDWIVNPPPRRIREIRERVGLPVSCPGGMKHIRQHEIAREALAAVMRHLRAWLSGRPPERGLWLVGPTGARKTLLLSCLCFEIAHRLNHDVYAWNVNDLMIQVQSAAQNRASAFSQDALESARVLFLDDLGSRRPTPASVDTLFALVDGIASGWRRPHRQTLYCTSDMAPPELAAYLSTVGETIGDRIVRRLAEACDVVSMQECPSEASG